MVYINNIYIYTYIRVITTHWSDHLWSYSFQRDPSKFLGVGCFPSESSLEEVSSTTTTSGICFRGFLLLSTMANKTINHEKVTILCSIFLEQKTSKRSQHIFYFFVFKRYTLQYERQQKKPIIISHPSPWQSRHLHQGVVVLCWNSEGASRWFFASLRQQSWQKAPMPLGDPQTDSGGWPRRVTVEFSAWMPLVLGWDHKQEGLHIVF